MLKLRQVDLRRDVEATRKLQPKVPELQDEVERLMQEVEKERDLASNLSQALEDPSNEKRWRKLGGKDPDSEECGAKIRELDARLDDKKEQLLEKELILEEVTALSDRLRLQAAEGRMDTLELAKKVNDFQAKIKTVTRKMMATVSELSMYQALAMKLQQEKHEGELILEDARWRLDNDQPPTDDAEKEWFRMENEKLRAVEDRAYRLQRAAMSEVSGQPPQRTAAEQRPNAYIPDELGLPRPYGAHAPFKPTEIGSTMRHIRKPQPQTVVI
uniref:Coiled-coil domain-containing protein 146 n=2 Tax=Palpitomonas bilix TaxID=652834 RepID=A0A7S3D2I3_9EUKA|mmetsp:Transcript_19444/g.49840  ORF Transcript_19444/g.49840 Transcript_19444/m.49840 type:complete len:272 (+) Transcript_19444:132-947(+)